MSSGEPASNGDGTEPAEAPKQTLYQRSPLLQTIGDLPDLLSRLLAPDRPFGAPRYFHRRRVHWKWHVVFYAAFLVVALMLFWIAGLVR